MTFRDVAKILADLLDTDVDQVEPTTALSPENGVHAIDMAKLVVECERRFNVIIHDEDVHEFAYVDDIVQYIQRMVEDA